MQAADIDVSQDGEFGVDVGGLEKLRMEFDREAVNFFLRENCVFDFLLGLLGGIGGVSGSEVAAASLDLVFLRFFQRNFQAVKPSIEFQVLRRKAEDVRVFGSGGSAAKAFVVVVVVLKENAAGSIGEDGENVGVGGGFLHVVLLMEHL